MSINRGMDTEDMVCKHNGILLSHKEEQNNAICRNMTRLRDCHIECNKSDTERQMSCNITYTWSLNKRGHKWTYLHNRSRVTDVEQMYGYQGIEGRDELGDWDWYIHTTIHKIDNKDLLYTTGSSSQYSVIADMRKESEKKRVDICICIYITDSFWCTLETNTL